MSRIKGFFLLFPFFLFSHDWITSFEESSFPVDITLLMIEVKYDDSKGVKICEIQPVCHSSFFGFDYVYQDYGLMGKKIANYLLQFGKKFWFMNPAVSHKPVREQFRLQGWKSFSDWNHLFLRKDQAYLNGDPYDIGSYSDIVYAKLKNRQEASCFCRNFPKALLVDRAIVPYMYDKGLQNSLFLKDPCLEKIKPKWALFEKKYHPLLAREIVEKIAPDSGVVVIKPTSADRGKGVIIVTAQELDLILQKILLSPSSYSQDLDRGYNYWHEDKASFFVVEEFIQTKPLMVNQALFDTTFRMAAAFVYHQKKIHLHFLGSYCNLGDIPIDHPGSLNQKYKTSLLLDQTIRTPEEIEQKIYQELSRPLTVLYQKMLYCVEK